jgi:uncharacterized protein YidB (DUF937 family)
MGALDFVMEEVQSRFGISGAKANSLLSGLLSFITQQSGGVSGFIDRFKSAGLGDVLSSWFSGATRSLSTEQVETVLGSSTLSNLASKAGDFADDSRVGNRPDATQADSKHRARRSHPDHASF